MEAELTVSMWILKNRATNLKIPKEREPRGKKNGKSKVKKGRV
jgi:hypothetical protein